MANSIFFDELYFKGGKKAMMIAGSNSKMLATSQEQS